VGGIHRTVTAIIPQQSNHKKESHSQQEQGKITDSYQRSTHIVYSLFSNHKTNNAVNFSYFLYFMPSLGELAEVVVARGDGRGCHGVIALWPLSLSLHDHP